MLREFKNPGWTFFDKFDLTDQSRERMLWQTRPYWLTLRCNIWLDKRKNEKFVSTKTLKSIMKNSAFHLLLSHRSLEPHDGWLVWEVVRKLLSVCVRL
jgi:hypothetical protein